MYIPTTAQKSLRTLVSGPAKHILVYGGARSGKTFEIINTLVTFAVIAGGRFAVLRQRYNTVKTSIYMDTLPKVLHLCWGNERVEFHNADTFIRFPRSGAEIWFIGLDDSPRVDKILGKEFTCMYFNECSEISFSAIETAWTRCSQKNEGIQNKIFYDCNPPVKTHWSYQLFVKKISPITHAPLPDPDNYVTFKMNPHDNKENVSEEFLKELENLSPAKRERFLLGEWQDDNTDALWNMSVIEDNRINTLPDNWLDKIVVVVDPAVTGNATSDHTGIIVAGVHYGDNTDCNQYYILADESLKAHPSEWSRRVADVYTKYEANEVIVETNQGGEMVIDTLRSANFNLPIKGVRATHGKLVRAEPIATLYNNGLVHHVGEFPLLEEELTSYTGRMSEKSPDRMDALVWALTALSDNKEIYGGDFYF